MLPAARITDTHICPMVAPGPCPHVGGPIIKGHPKTLIGFMPASRITDSAVCCCCIDTIAKGSATVLIGYLNAARLTDMTSHGGSIISGYPTVLIGDVGMGAPSAPSGPVAPSGPNTPGGDMSANPDPVGGGGGGAGTAKPKVIVPRPPPPLTPVESTPQQQALSDAKQAARPFCEICQS